MEKHRHFGEKGVVDEEREVVDRGNTIDEG